MQPRMELGKAPPAMVKVSKTGASSSVGKHLMQAKQYPVTCCPLINHQPKNCLPSNAPVHHAAVLRLSYSSESAGVMGSLMGLVMDPFSVVWLYEWQWLMCCSN